MPPTTTMRFDVVTLLPEMFESVPCAGVTRRAYESGQVEVQLHNPRDFASGNYKRVDDRPFGGGPGMVMMAEPLMQCVSHIQSAREAPAPVVLFSPVGQRLDHAMVSQWARSAGAVLVCGRYEGIDQRWVDACVTHQISLGDFVISGGEIAAMAFLDAVARLQPGVLNDAQSHVQDSFNPALDGLLDCPHFTRPEVWRDAKVPSVLMSGHHADIEIWRRQQRVLLTAKVRPDLIALARKNNLLTRSDEESLAQYAAADAGKAQAIIVG